MKSLAMNDAKTMQNQPIAEHEAPHVNQDHVQLAQRAADGDRSSRTEINQLIHPIISCQTNRFCKRFCRENRYRYACSLEAAWGSSSKEALMCEWGNASYAWMLDDLTNRKRLLQFEGKNGARINDYLYSIANSLPFYERWKNWRFGRKVHVPTYIQELSPDASKVFFALRAREEIPNIAQKLGKTTQQIETLCQSIIVILTQKNRLHLLAPPSTVSLTEAGTDQDHKQDRDGSETDIPFYDEAPEMQEDKLKLRQAWGSLSVVEQFVLEAMQIEEQDAADVLYALKKMNISIKQGVAATDTTRQQLYYFRRKTLAKLANLMGEV